MNFDGQDHKDDGNRILGFCRDGLASLGSTTTYKTAGIAELGGSRRSRRFLWVESCVGKTPRAPK